jgi:DNA-binding MarR family transcriptional regulator
MARRREPTEFLEQLGRVRRCILAFAGRNYALGELGATQAKFLLYLGQHGQSSQAELARATGTDKALTGRILLTLIERGWVRRERSLEDRRQYVLELSAAGRRAHIRVEKQRADFVVRLAQVLDERDLDDFGRIAHKILKAFEEPTARES